MIRLHYAFIGTGAILATLAFACSDETDPAVVGAGGGGNAQHSGGLGGIDFTGSGGNGGAGAQNVGGEGQASHVWDVAHGGLGAVFPRSLALDPSGNVVVVGTYNTAGGAVDLGGGALPTSSGDAVFVAKYTGSGDHVWSKSFDGADVQGARDVACDGSGNIWLVGEFKGVFSFGGPTLDAAGNQFPDGFVAKLDSNGDHLFSRAVGVGIEESDSVTGVAVDASGNVVLTGFFQNSIEFGGGTLSAAGGAGDYDIFVAKLDANGGHVFSKALGGTTRQDGLAIAAGPSGAIAVVGYTTGSIDLGGGLLTHDGADEGAVVTVLDASGNHVFSELYPSSGSARATGVAFGPGGDVFVAGNFKGSIDLGGGNLTAPSGNDDIFVARHEPSGDLVYGERFGGNGSEKVTAVAVDANGYAVVSGWFKGSFAVNGSTTLETVATSNDAFALRVGPPGNGFWGLQAHAIDNAQGRRVVTTPSGDVILLGDFTGEIDLGGGPFGAGAAVDMFLARFAP